MALADLWRMSPGLRRTSAVVAIVALAIGGTKVASDHATPGTGFSTVQTAAADPTGPTGGPSGDGGTNGSQFQPPSMPVQQPDYQGGNNQPPLNQDGGISIYNSGAPQAEQQAPGQQAGQQPQQAQQPAHGTQIPDYQTATPYTQGPGKANPDYQAPQQGNQPQQGQQPQQQPDQNQPSQAPTRNQPDQQQPEEKESEPKDQPNKDECSAAGSGKDFPLEKFAYPKGVRLVNNNAMTIANDTKWGKELEQAIAEWNNVQPVKLSLFKPDPNNPAIKPDATLKYMTPKQIALLGPGIRGYTDIPGWVTVDASLGDILLNEQALDADAKTMSILATIAHEIGHGLGLTHSCSGNLMQASPIIDSVVRPDGPTSVDGAAAKANAARG